MVAPGVACYLPMEDGGKFLYLWKSYPFFMQQETVNVFIAYSRKDTEIKERLKTALKVLVQIKQIDSIWDDSAIEAGADWENSIHAQLDDADIILLLVSRDFLASDYCFGTEMNKAMKAHEEGRTKVIPIIARHCSWDMTELGKLQALPENGKPIVDKWDAEDIPYFQVERYLTAVATTIKETKRLIKQKTQFEHFFNKGEDDYRKQNWIQALEWYNEALRLHNDIFEIEKERIKSLIDVCEKRVRFKDLFEEAKVLFNKNDFLGSYLLLQEALKINVTIETRDLFKKTAKILFEENLKSADLQFLNMNWYAATQAYNIAFEYANSANLENIIEKKFIRRRDFSDAIFALNNETEEWLSRDNINQLFATPNMKQIFKQIRGF